MHLDVHGNMTLQEMVRYLWEEFGIHTTKSSVSRALHSAGWSKKKPRRRAQEQDPDLVDLYLYRTNPSLSRMTISPHLESDADQIHVEPLSILSE